MKSLVWFRRDLRLADNPALAAALSSGQPVEAVYLFAPEDEGDWPIGRAAGWYLRHSLAALQKDLASIGIPLRFLSGSSRRVLPSLISELQVSRVYWNRVVEPAQTAIDEAMVTTLTAAGITARSFDEDGLLMPEQVHKGDGTAYCVFAAFWRKAQELLGPHPPTTRLHPRPGPVAAPISFPANDVDRLNLLSHHPWHLKLHRYWQPGESSAQRLLDEFLDRKATLYEIRRDLPFLDGTSRLSPALHFGELSAARVYGTCQEALIHEPHQPARTGIGRFLAELGWREFGKHLLYAFPASHSQSLDQRFERTEVWLPDPSGRSLAAWKRGETGVPLVDAGMRQLWETGWMHNRVRMVAASYLTKNLGIHWLHGARWFWDTLVDADLGSNTLGWQWVAGCGADAAPYYRIFNPELQARKFDPKRTYITRWLGPDSPRSPAVDLKASRAHALSRYNAAIRKTAT